MLRLVLVLPPVSPATEVYKLLFRVNRPAAGSPGRVAPRIFWSLISLSRRNSPDRTAGGSPIVTRLNIESSELKHLAMVLKVSWAQTWWLMSLINSNVTTPVRAVIYLFVFFTNISMCSLCASREQPMVLRNSRIINLWDSDH
ncbi:unnamed protein product [Echinostoma caproni]|uniref:Secreted protein n=1 Tax=Echinostoma caproni TaxID=27848 RepID=A0A183B8A3_9TREM|nr:unnamed protein product [Echinostoma caproni]